jgi:ferrous iron transport protein B
MARAALIMDRVMGAVGLNGKAFIPLLSSYACAIPGIMATRTIENPRDRLATILVAPWMSCSARLPVYSLMIATLIPHTEATPWQKAGIMLALYGIGTLAAFLTAWLLKRTLQKKERSLFLMELPNYRRPHIRQILFQMTERAWIFIKRAGTVILALSIVLWFLMNYPKSEAGGLEQSYAGQMGKAIEPIIKPLGFDWKIGIGIIASFAAREVFVSTMSIVYHVEDQEDDSNMALRDRFLQETWPDGSLVYTSLTCISLMLFYVFALQCVSTIAVVRRETNSWRWPLIQLAYMTIVAYLASLLVYQGGKLWGFS